MFFDEDFNAYRYISMTPSYNKSWHRTFSSAARTAPVGVIPSILPSFLVHLRVISIMLSIYVLATKRRRGYHQALMKTIMHK